MLYYILYTLIAPAHEANADGVMLQRCSKEQNASNYAIAFFGDLCLPFQLQACADCATSHDRIGAEIFAQFC